MMTFLAFVIIVIGIPVNAWSTYRLWQFARQWPDLVVVRERAVAGTFILIGIISFAIVYIDGEIDAPGDPLLRRIVTVLVAIIPASYWLLLDRRRP